MTVVHTSVICSKDRYEEIAFRSTGDTMMVGSWPLSEGSHCTPRRSFAHHRHLDGDTITNGRTGSLDRPLLGMVKSISAADCSEV